MAGLIYQLISVIFLLCAVQTIRGYSFKNCIEDPSLKGLAYNCIHRNETNMTAVIHDLPQSALNLTVSIIPAQHIPNLSFAHLTNLTHLRLDHNILTTTGQFAFKNLHRLKSLNMSFNDILELNTSLFEDLHSLNFLSLGNNKLKKLPEGIFSSLLNLKTLDLSKNFLTNFSEIAQSVSHLTNLSKLDLSSNNLTSLSHSNVSLPQSLTTLYISRNNLLTLGCEHLFFSHVKMLDLSYNPRLTTMAFQKVDLKSITHLHLRSTSVNIVEFLNISNIYAGHVDFSNTGLKNGTMITELCKLLRRKLKWIKNLDLSSNGIGNLKPNKLLECPIIETLDLSRNQLQSTSCLSFLKGQTKIKTFTAEHNHFKSLPNCTVHYLNFQHLEELSYRYNRILSVSSQAFYHTPNVKTLKLNINTIAFLHHKALKGLKKLEELRLDNNLLTDLFKDTFEDLVRLRTLNLRNNRIAVIFNGTFLSLTNLTILDLGGNKITHFEPSGLDGLKRLCKLYLDGNQLKEIDTSHYHIFQDTLRVLDLTRNQIRFLSTDISFSPFMNLSKLGDLKLDEQQPYGLMALPRTLFRGLHSLESLYLTNNQIAHLADDVFDDLTGLKFLTLDNCCVGMTQLKPGVFKNLRNLTKLVVENIGIQNFSKEVVGNLSELRIIQLNHNFITSIHVDALESLPKLRYLDMRSLALSCTCKNNLLRNWTVNNQNVQVIYLYDLVCPNYEKFYKFDAKVCYIDLGKYMFLSTALVIVLFTASPLLFVKLYWKMKYSYYVFRAWFSEQWRRLREEEENCKYDAFISYNSSDEQWVMDELLPNLEGNGSSFKLCLHHRDFELGRYIVDNIVSAVYSSRKTICVVSRNFLNSEWCSLEIQLASYRLFDEHRDVLLLVFLEPIPERNLSSYHHMRKVMLKKTYLQWPDSDCIDPQMSQALFWNQLRQAIKRGSRDKTEESFTDGGCLSENETFKSESYYLLP